MQAEVKRIDTYAMAVRSQGGEAIHASLKLGEGLCDRRLEVEAVEREVIVVSLIEEASIDRDVVAGTTSRRSHAVAVLRTT